MVSAWRAPPAFSPPPGRPACHPRANRQPVAKPSHPHLSSYPQHPESSAEVPCALQAALGLLACLWPCPSPADQEDRESALNAAVQSRSGRSPCPLAVCFLSPYLRRGNAGSLLFRRTLRVRQLPGGGSIDARHQGGVRPGGPAAGPASSGAKHASICCQSGPRPAQEGEPQAACSRGGPVSLTAPPRLPCRSDTARRRQDQPSVETAVPPALSGPRSSRLVARRSWREEQDARQVTWVVHWSIRCHEGRLKYPYLYRQERGLQSRAPLCRCHGESTTAAARKVADCYHACVPDVARTAHEVHQLSQLTEIPNPPPHRRGIDGTTLWE